MTAIHSDHHNHYSSTRQRPLHDYYDDDGSGLPLNSPPGNTEPQAGQDATSANLSSIIVPCATSNICHQKVRGLQTKAR